MTPILLTRSRHAGKPRNGFGTSFGQVVFYALVAWDNIHDERGIIKPLDTKERAAWAIRVLNGLYPDRTYETVKNIAKEGVTAEQMEPFLQYVLDDLAKLEIAQKYGIDPE